MSEQFAYRFGIKTAFNANGSICVTKQMKISVANAAVFQYCLKAVRMARGSTGLLVPERI